MFDYQYYLLTEQLHNYSKAMAILVNMRELKKITGKDLREVENIADYLVANQDFHNKIGVELAVLFKKTPISNLVKHINQIYEGYDNSRDKTLDYIAKNPYSFLIRCNI